jgi:uncharacterized protein YegL
MTSTTAIQVYDNPQPRCACALLLDTSSSMDGEPIAELNRGVKQFFRELLSDDFARFSVEPIIITFGDEARVVQPFTSLAHADLNPDTLPELEANGMTPMGAAISLAMTQLEQRKQEYRRNGIPYYQPWMVLMTDGAPNDNWQMPAAGARALSDKRKLVFIGVGIGEDVDMDTLKIICPANRPPKLLQGLCFVEFFEWLSQSMGQVSRSSVGDKVSLPPTDGWEAI